MMDKVHQLIQRMETNTGSRHDRQVDLSRKGEMVYRDKGYSAVKPQAAMDKTMHRGTRGYPLSIKDEQRNRAIMRTRSLVERPFAVMKRVYRAVHTLVTTMACVHCKNLFSYFAFNLQQLCTINLPSS